MKELSVAALSIALLSAIIWTVIVYVVDPILPAQIVEPCTSSKAIRGSSVIYVTRGTGGGTASCKLRSPLPPLGSAFLIKRSWLLGICSAELLPEASLPCRRP